jgi:WD40 repeat protein
LYQLKIDFKIQLLFLEKLVLMQLLILGMTSFNVFSFYFRCTVVLYNPRKNRQSHIINAAKKTITSVGFSDDGRYLVNYNPATISMWNGGGGEDL